MLVGMDMPGILGPPPEFVGMIIALVGGFISGAIAAVIPGRARVVILLDGRALLRDSSDAGFFVRIKELKLPVKFIAPQAILFIATLCGVYMLTSQATPLKEYSILLNAIFAVVAFLIGILLAFLMGRKLSTDIIITREAYKAIMRKAVASSQIPSSEALE